MKSDQMSKSGFSIPYICHFHNEERLIIWFNLNAFIHLHIRRGCYIDYWT